MFLILVSFIFAYFNLQDHPVMVESDSECEIESKESSDQGEVDWINLNSHPVDDVSESSPVSVGM